MRYFTNTLTKDEGYSLLAFHSNSVLNSGATLPLAATLFSNLSQGHTVRNQEQIQSSVSVPETPKSPPDEMGYDWTSPYGQGDAWGHYSLGYAGIGGSGCHSNNLHMLRRDEDDELINHVEKEHKEESEDDKKEKHHYHGQNIDYGDIKRELEEHEIEMETKCDEVPW
ncbi:unnamed protein product [Didymodactylos carnosus]|uniref:Uncharacterized protein n=1 Tax=Didymodactylos carnosus TaxID=1234261 RepID=A0A8S2F8F2_9BILA|nr:unnamed protein product [Didymodactylos carnosus]CAF4196628.1 unnamed protein product [Didymodactylos carnosus]